MQQYSAEKGKKEIRLQPNPYRKTRASRRADELFSEDELSSVARFHRSLPRYRPTPLVSLSQLAAHLGIRDFWVKNEAERFDLKAFKVLGASYAVGKRLAREAGLDDAELTFDRLLERKPMFRNQVFVTATDGNHGRAAAWTAQTLGCGAVVYLPKGSAEIRVDAIRECGAEATVVDGSYDDAVRLAARHAEERGWILLQDTSWPGYEEIPAHIMQGYATLMREAADQLGHAWPTHVFVQAGVGSLAAAILACLCRFTDRPRPFFTVVEPTGADCFYRSVAAGDGKAHPLEGILDTAMAGLSCGTPGSLSWEILKENADAFAACSDSVAFCGMRVLGHPLTGDERVVSGESGAVTAGLVFELLHEPRFTDLRKVIGLGSNSRVLVFSTEGDTDPELYRSVLGRVEP